MKKLHFYPGDRLLILYNIGKVLIKVNAVGGPRNVIPDPYMDLTPTDPGNYIIYGARKIPDKWVFNDFGPFAVRYFIDKNKNRRLDKTERLHGEMIHTTPTNEAEHVLGTTVVLDISHGCIHIKPADRDRLKLLGAFNQGVPFIIHKYTERYIP